jgi:Fe-S oxidoreductase
MQASPKLSYYVEDKTNRLEDRPTLFLRAMAAVLEHSSYALPLELYSRISARCSRCAASCQVYQATGEDRDIPCHRSELLLQIYRRYFTRLGALKARLTGSGFTLTDDYLLRMAEDFYRCTACRRCMDTCPMGIDHGLLTHLGRWLLAEVDLTPKALVVAVREQLEGVGNTSAIPVPALRDTLEFLEEEFEDIYQVQIPFPVDQEDSEYVFFPAVSDYLLEADTLMGNAAVLFLTGASWTIGTGYFDGINYGLFYSDRMMERIGRKVIDEVRRLRGRKVLVGECGHATRSAWLLQTLWGSEAPPVVNCLEYAWDQLRSGRLPIDSKRLIEKRVTYHDPCNIARTGKIVHQPRELLRAICRDFVEMQPGGEQNYCCGGGSGTVSIDEIREFRTGKSGLLKARQIRDTGAQIVVSPCANCKKQLREVCEDNGLEEVEVVGLHDLLLQVLDFESLRASQNASESASANEQTDLQGEQDGSMD